MDIRLGNKDDFAALYDLDDACATADAIGGQKFRVLGCHGMLDYFLGCKGLIVAEEAGWTVGYVLTCLIDWMHADGPHVWIEHIAIHPQQRCRGIATRMLDFVCAHYKGRARLLHGAIHPKNEASLALFSRYGAELSERVLFYKRMDVDASAAGK